MVSLWKNSRVWLSISFLFIAITGSFFLNKFTALQGDVTYTSCPNGICVCNGTCEYTFNEGGATVQCANGGKMVVHQGYVTKTTYCYSGMGMEGSESSMCSTVGGECWRYPERVDCPTLECSNGCSGTNSCALGNSWPSCGDPMWGCGKDYHFVVECMPANTYSCGGTLSSAASSASLGVSSNGNNGSNSSNGSVGSNGSNGSVGGTGGTDAGSGGGTGSGGGGGSSAQPPASSASAASSASQKQSSSAQSVASSHASKVSNASSKYSVSAGSSNASNKSTSLNSSARSFGTCSSMPPLPAAICANSIDFFVHGANRQASFLRCQAEALERNLECNDCEYQSYMENTPLLKECLGECGTPLYDQLYGGKTCVTAERQKACYDSCHTSEVTCENFPPTNLSIADKKRYAAQCAEKAASCFQNCPVYCPVCPGGSSSSRSAGSSASSASSISAASSRSSVLSSSLSQSSTSLRSSASSVSSRTSLSSRTASDPCASSSVSTISSNRSSSAVSCAALRMRVVLSQVQAHSEGHAGYPSDAVTSRITVGGSVNGGPVLTVANGEWFPLTDQVLGGGTIPVVEKAIHVTGGATSVLVQIRPVRWNSSLDDTYVQYYGYIEFDGTVPTSVSNQNTWYSPEREHDGSYSAPDNDEVSVKNNIVSFYIHTKNVGNDDGGLDQFGISLKPASCQSSSSSAQSNASIDPCTNQDSSRSRSSSSSNDYWVYDACPEHTGDDLSNCAFTGQSCPGQGVFTGQTCGKEHYQQGERVSKDVGLCCTQGQTSSNSSVVVNGVCCEQGNCNPFGSCANPFQNFNACTAACGGNSSASSNISLSSSSRSTSSNGSAGSSANSSQSISSRLSSISSSISSRLSSASYSSISSHLSVSSSRSSTSSVILSFYSSSSPFLECTGYECATVGDAFCALQQLSCIPLATTPCFKCGNETTLPPGSSCTDDNQCASRMCVNGMCQQPLPPGFPCTRNSQCSTNFCKDGICQNPLPLNTLAFLGESCTRDVECVTNLCKNNLCTACNQGVDCSSGLCRNGVCLAKNLPNGAVCTTDMQCLSGLCLHNVCTAASTLPATSNQAPVVIDPVTGKPLFSAPQETLPATVIELPFTNDDSISDVRYPISDSGDQTAGNGKPLASAPSTPSTGPAALAVMIAGASAGYLWRRKKQ